ncbi:MAG: TonB-dependent receptor [Candidatus Marinimicrobia bacterium]|jgi:outer membrane receptor protein involved in Fe transport|nr:TonB-dependent receptor [Candidatus Neomarinimicrobiota bacterium]MBT4035322.1 TonB-dependent receptor [Candidatus Neomarinimicrobiota bacterium]MBT4359705.1 TonB-dependent receptor [Candidatus Neomarinimicrobiota bacterium]MBT4713717.1 TonB-dependent receptor [Candidatus Neomarinimicrobiota bacterium]MBT4946931.1 TonB-dependent receptor [Candidatus Neomarinimicrobiota bacterium]
MIDTGKWLKISIGVLLLVPSLLLAGQGGKIAGTVTDGQTGEVLPGANVMVTHRWIDGEESPLDAVLGAATDLEGHYYILNIYPGTYTLRVDFIGMSSKQINEIDVLVDMTSFIDVSLEAAALEGEIVVVESQRDNTVQTDLTATKTVYQISDVQSIAGVSDIGDIINLQADVVDDHFRGGRSGESSYLLGGGTIINPLTNSKAFSPIVTGLEQVEVYTSGFSAEYGNAQSGVINMVTKEGREKWESRLEVSVTAPYYKVWEEFFDEDSNRTVEAGSPYDVNSLEFYEILMDTAQWLEDNPQQPGRVLYDLGYGFGGQYLPPRTTWPPNPLTIADSIQIARLGQVSWLQSVRDVGMQYDNTYDNRLDFSTGGPITNNVKAFIALRQNTSFTRIPTQSPDLDRQLMSSLVYKPNTSDKYKLTWNYNTSRDTYFNSSYRYWLFDPTLSTSQRLSASTQLGFDWNHIFDGSTFGHIRLNALQIENEELINLLGEGQLTTDYSKNSNWVDLTGPSNHRVGRLFNDSGDDLTRTYTAQGDITSQINNSNMLKAGAQFSYYEVYVDRLYNRDGDADIRILNFEVNPYEGALFAQDKMEFEGMIANMGLRLDFYQLNKDFYSDLYGPLRNPNYDPTVPYLERGPYYSDSLAAKENTKLYAKLQPRIGVSFPVDETTVFHLNYGTFSQRPNFNQLFYNQITFNNEIEILGNPRLKPEETNAYDMGIVKGIPSLGLTLDISAYYKDVKNLVETAYYYDEQQAVYRTYINKDYADIKGFHVNLERRDGTIRGYVRYNYESATGKSSNDLNAPVTYFEVADPVYGLEQLPDPADVYLDYDRTHKAVFNLRYKSPKKFGPQIMGTHPLAKFSISATYKYYTGRPYTDPESGLLYTERTPDEREMRMRIEKEVNVSGSKATIYVEGYNLTNDYTWSYGRAFDNPYNTPRWKTEPDNILTYSLFEPYISSQDIYLLSNQPRHWRFGLIVKF